MGYKVVVHKRAVKFVEKLTPDDKRAIHKKIKALSISPRAQGKLLKYSEFRKIRIDDYRAIYKVSDEEKRVFVLFIGHRKNVYDDFSRLLL